MTSPITIPKSTVYAIIVLTTKAGKPRKRLAWAIWEFTYWMCWKWSLAKVAGDAEIEGWTSKLKAQRFAKRAESALGCKCAVVEITLTGKVV